MEVCSALKGHGIAEAWTQVQSRLDALAGSGVLAAAAAICRDTLGATVSDPVDMPEHGVTTIFVELSNAKIELLYPPGEGSPIAAFLERNASGGMQHVCYEVEDITAARDRLVEQGARVLGDGEPRIGAHGKPVLFLHPKDFCGTLVEIEQV